MKKTTNGFTLVELLIVIVVIAILAAISVVAYNGIQDRANNTTVQSDMGTIAKILEMYRVDNSQYPAASQLSTMDNRLKFSKGSYQTVSNAVLYCQSSDQAEYALLGKSKSDTTYIITSSNKTPQEYSSTFPGSSAVVCANVDSSLEPELWVHSGAGWSGAVG